MHTEDVYFVAIDDGLFWLVADDDGNADAGRSGFGDEALVDEALENGLFIAQGPGAILVVPPQQWASDRPVTVQTWSERPPAELPGWDDVCEASIVAGSGGLFWATNYSETVDLPVVAGTYRVRIAGKGSETAEWDQPADEWLLQFWPATEIAPPVRLRRPYG